MNYEPTKLDRLIFGLTMAASFLPLVLGVTETARGDEQVLRPVAGGTIADGGTHGPFDGVGDAADWSFNESSYEGAITLVREPPPALEQRVVFEFNVNGATIEAPLTAYFYVTVRGAARFPASSLTLEIHAYEADLTESLDDFLAVSKGLVASQSIAPFQPATEYVAEVSDLINEARASGAGGVGFRLQIAPVSPTDSLQVFLDVLDSDPATQPYLRLSDRVPGDGNNDRSVDRLDLPQIIGCLQGPNATRSPPCAPFDFDVDAHVDLNDFARFERVFAIYAE